MSAGQALHATAFLGGLLAILWAYDYRPLASLGPISLHQWRQADGASLARSYHDHGMRFLEPQVHNVAGGDHHAVGEFPALYYAVACLYRVFGVHDAIFRWFNFAILVVGLFLYSRALLRWVDDLWLALALAPPLLLLSSPLLAFYGFNFLPNTTAFALILIAGYAYVRFVETQRLVWFYFACAIACLAGLLKVPALVPFVALVAAGGSLQLLSRREAWVGQVPRWPHLFAAAIAVLGANAAWILWARSYNEQHGSRLFLLGTKPLWEMSRKQFGNNLAFLLTDQRHMYFDLETLLALVLLIGVLLVLARRLPRFVASLFVFTLLGSAAYLVLFFGQLRVHEYYLIDVMPLVALLLALGVWGMVKLPLDIADPLERFREVHARMAERKASPALDLLPSFAEALVLLPRPLVRALSFVGSQTVQLIVTNVPGIMMPRYVAGSRIIAGYPFAPLAPQCPVSIALYGYDGHLFIGIDADGTTMPDVESFAATLRGAFVELVEAALEPAARSSYV